MEKITSTVQYLVDSLDEQNFLTARVDNVPDSCPRCHYSLEAIEITGVRINESDIERLEIVFQCPRNKCQSLFISYYEQGGSLKYEFTLIGSAPRTGRGREFETEIQEISKDFTIIYNQAARAEELELNRVAGMGYRRAFEFLIKDFLISEFPDKELEIKKEMLGKCIKNYITDGRIKQIAERAAWLGNDETHYERRWVDKDVGDLKKLIEITMHFILMEKQASKYINEMS